MKNWKHRVTKKSFFVAEFKIRIYNAVILSLVLCETWSLKLGEEHGLRVFENKVLKTIFRPRRDEVTEGWRKLNNEELRDLYASRSIIRMMKSRRLRWARHVARIGAKRNAYRLLVGKEQRYFNKAKLYE
jgi:hypothetical protein